MRYIVRRAIAPMTKRQRVALDEAGGCCSCNPCAVFRCPWRREMRVLTGAAVCTVTVSQVLREVVYAAPREEVEGEDGANSFYAHGTVQHGTRRTKRTCHDRRRGTSGCQIHFWCMQI